MTQHQKIIAFDCDSTLSAIEGIDELARLSDPETFRNVEALTNQAMNGQAAIADTFRQRLELIKPSRELCAQIGELYIQHAEATAKETVARLQDAGWHCLIISGGFAPCIRPFADFLGIQDLEAVPLFFNEDGSYQDYDDRYPTTYNGGKTEIIQKYKNKHHPKTMVMVGDGISDLETAAEVDHFIAYTGYIERQAVVAKAKLQISRLANCINLIS